MTDFYAYEKALLNIITSLPNYSTQIAFFIVRSVWLRFIVQLCCMSPTCYIWISNWFSQMFRLYQLCFSSSLFHEYIVYCSPHKPLLKRCLKSRKPSREYSPIKVLSGSLLLVKMVSLLLFPLLVVIISLSYLYIKHGLIWGLFFIVNLCQKHADIRRLRIKTRLSTRYPDKNNSG